MLNYKLAAALHGRLQELCINETVLKTPIVFEREGNINNGFIVSIAEAIDADTEALELTANSMNSINIGAKDSFIQRKNAMCDAIVSANEAVFSKGSGGCTIVSAAVKGKQLAITNLGCSAAFLLHGGELKRLTDEHCTFSMIKDEGVKLNTRYIGLEDKTGLNLPVYDDEKLNAGDVILLCSSTVCDALAEDELLSLLQLPNTVTERVDMIKSAIIDANSDADELDFSLAIIEVGRESGAEVGSFGGKRLPELHESPWYALALAGVFIVAALVIVIISHNMKTNGGNGSSVEAPSTTPITTNGIWNPVATPIPGNGNQSGGNFIHKIDPDASPTPMFTPNPGSGGNKVIGGGSTGNGNGNSTIINPGGGTSTNPPSGGGKPLPKPTTQPPVYTPPVASNTPTPPDKPTPTPAPDVPTDAPETDEPVTDVPETDEPVTDEPATDEPVTDAPTEPPTPEETPEPEEPNPESNPLVKP